MTSDLLVSVYEPFRFFFAKEKQTLHDDLFLQSMKAAIYLGVPPLHLLTVTRYQYMCVSMHIK